MTYLVKVPLESAWQPSGAFVVWLKESRHVTRVEPVEEYEPVLATPGDTEESHWWIQFRGSDVPREFVLLRNEVMKTLEIRLVASNRYPGQLNRCTVRMRPFLVGSTLVEAKLQVRSDFLRDLVSILVSLTGDAADAKLREFGEGIAIAHRGACLTPPEPQPSNRIHVISIGVNEVSEPRAQAEFALRPVQFAESDAASFYYWADAAFADSDQDAPPIRNLMTGPAATAEAIRAVLNDIERPEGDSPIKPDDTILFFLAGQVKSHQDPGRRTRSPRFLAWNADPQIVDLTTISCLEILDSLRASQASRCLFFCDACFMGGARNFLIEGLRPNRESALPKPTEAMIGPSTALFAAEVKYTDAAESEAFGHGVFTFYLLEKLREVSSNDEQSISLIELKTHVEDEVRQQTSGRQEPFVHIPEALQSCQIESSGRIE
ncbi:MAG: caspase family protein [Planctomycetota bacterium]